MWRLLAKSSRLWIIPALSLIPVAARALEVDDPAHGFHFSLPDDFVRDPKPKDAEVLYQYVRRSKDADEVGTVVQVKALDATIAVGERLNPSQLEADPGYNIGFDQIEWQTHKMDVIVSTPQDPEKAARVVVYTTLFPISGQAVRFRVAGPASGPNAARAFFDKTVAGFTNTKPLQMTPAGQPAQERKIRLIIKAVLFGGVALIGVIVKSVQRAKEKKMQQKLQGFQQPAPPPPGIRRP